MTETFEGEIICDILLKIISSDEVALYNNEQDIHVGIEACELGVKLHAEGFKYETDID